MSAASGGAPLPNGFKIVFEELKRRTREPRNQFVYWIYFVFSICVIGGISILIELYKYYWSGTSPNSFALYAAMATYFPALVGSSSMQIMFEKTSDKRIVAFFTACLIVTGIFAILLISASGEISKLNWFVLICACVFALWIGWISNAYNLALYDEDPPPIDAAVGGDNPNAELQGNTNGFQT